MRLWCALIISVSCVSAAVVVPLDGPDWFFATDSAISDLPPPWLGNDAKMPKWEQAGTITVPGCWSSPTSTLMTPSTPYGNATPTRNYNFIGQGW